MKLNRSTDMALRIAMLAAASNRRLTVDELSDQLDLPRNHVAKVVQRLHHLGVLVTIRGRSGGVAFAEGGEMVTVGRVVRAFEGDDEVVSCDASACPLRAACRLRGELRRAQDAFLAVLDGVSLGGLVESPTGPLLLTLGLGSAPAPAAAPVAGPAPRSAPGAPAGAVPGASVEAVPRVPAGAVSGVPVCAGDGSM